MFLPWAALGAVATDGPWRGPATVTFAVQFAGDPFDLARSDVRVRFLGAKGEREERIAWFDPELGAWRATLYARQGGQYRATLVRNGKDVLAENAEGIVDVPPNGDVGLLAPQGTRDDRLGFDTGLIWTGVGADLGTDATPEAVDALAKAGATWVRVAMPSDPLGSEAQGRFGAAMDAVVRNGLFYTLALPPDVSLAFRRYALARYGESLLLVQWEAPADLADPWKRATSSTAAPWPGLFEDQPGAVRRAGLGAEPQSVPCARCSTQAAGRTGTRPTRGGPKGRRAWARATG